MSQEIVDDLEVAADDPSDESEDDTHPTASAASDAVVSGTDWTAETLLSQLRRGNIELNPSFQRRDAWTLDRKTRFIESLVMGIPVPQLVLAERPGQRGSYIVIDGKQRLLSLAQFGGLAQDSERNNFALVKLTLRPDLNGQTYSSLQEDRSLFAELNAFENATIRTVVIKNWSSEEYLYLVFHRLNTGSVPLSPQELRQALFPGPFAEFVDKYSFSSAAIHSALGIRGKDFRMRDAELLTRAFAFDMFLPMYSGNLKGFLDQTCQELNERWKAEAPELEAKALEIDKAIRACESIFGEYAFRRVSGGSRESRFNRAVFDTQMYSMTRSDVREAALVRTQELRDAYVRLAGTRSFSDATGSTTKSISATYSRLSQWAEALRGVVGPGVPALRMGSDNRIHEA